MQAEPQRSQYLEAMGLTAWVSRYRLPNATPTPECEWLEPEAAPSQAPAQRLHALLDDEELRPAAPSTPSHAPSTAPRQVRRARELLGGADDADAPVATPTPPAEPAEMTAAEPHDKPQQALRFTLQVAALDGRWLILLPSQHEPDATARRLLASLLQAAGIVSGAAPAFQTFHWPMMEGQPVEAPLEEARDGLRAFVEGQHRRGWRPERLLVFGMSETLAPVLELAAGRCRLLDIAGWQGLSLEALAQSATAKRELWPQLVEWREAWQRGADGGHAGQGSDDVAS